MDEKQAKPKKNGLTKRDLSLVLANKHGLTQEKAIEVMQTVLNEIIAALKRGENVEFREFGVFSLVVRKARIGRNPRKPSETIMVPERHDVKFKPGRMMKLVLGKMGQQQK